jgi:hypothetical protein
LRQQSNHTCNDNSTGHSGFEAKQHQFLQIMIPDLQSYQGLTCPSIGKCLHSSSTFVDKQPVMTMTHDTTEPSRALHPIRLSTCLVVREDVIIAASLVAETFWVVWWGTVSDSGELHATVGAVAMLNPRGDPN